MSIATKCTCQKSLSGYCNDKIQECQKRLKSKPESTKGCVWVNVKEGMPAKPGRYQVRRECFTIEDPDEWAYYDGHLFTNYCGYKVVEWLDESPTAHPDKEDAAGSVNNTTWGPDEYPDLSSCTAEQKHETITGLVQVAAKEIMRMFYAFGLKTHIECTVVNEPTNETFEFSFVKVADAAGSGKEEVIAFAQWLNDEDYRPFELKGSRLWLKGGTSVARSSAVLYDIYKSQNK